MAYIAYLLGSVLLQYILGPQAEPANQVAVEQMVGIFAFMGHICHDCHCSQSIVEEWGVPWDDHVQKIQGPQLI